MSVHEHKEKGKKSIRCFVITVSDTRDETTDTSGQTIKKFLADEGHQATGYQIVKDEPVEIEKLLNRSAGRPMSMRSSSMAAPASRRAMEPMKS